MSLDATTWAWRTALKEKPGGARKPMKRLVLLSLADRAGEDHTCYPSMQRLEKDTGIERKTVLKIIAELQEDGMIADTGERKGATKRVKVYKLKGVKGRETVPETEQLQEKNLPETVPETEQYQKRNGSINGTLNSANNGTLNSPNNGTQNLPKNLPVESKNKKDWLCFKKLREEIYLADPEMDFEYLMTATWGDREKRAFEIYNAGRDLCDELMNFHFADWLIHAYRTKYSKPASGQNAKPAAEPAPKQLTEKQIAVFAQKLAHHGEFAGKFSEPGDSYEKLAAKIAAKLENPAQAKKWEKYLKQVGFTGVLAGEAS